MARSRTLAAILVVLAPLGFLGADCLNPKPKVYAPTREIVPDGAVLSLHMGAPKDVTVPPELVSLAPQYFHPSTRDPFALDGAFYDPIEPTTRRALPQGMNRFWRSLGDTFVGYGADGIRVARRDETTSHPVAKDTPNLGLTDGTRARNDDLWLALADRPVMPTNLSLLRVRGASGQLFPNPLGVRPRIWTGDAAVAATDDDRVAIAWVEPSASGLSLMISFRDPTGASYSPPLAADAVPLDANAAALSGRTGTELVMIGLVDRVAIAWRPLMPAEPVDPGSASAPPSRPVRAEVRLVVVDGKTSPTVIRHGTWAVPLGGTSGIGPWPLAPAGLAGTRLGEVATFAWNDVSGTSARVLAAIARPGETPKEVAALAWRLQFHTTPSGTELFLFAPNGAVRTSTVEYTF